MALAILGPRYLSSWDRVRGKGTNSHRAPRQSSTCLSQISRPPKDEPRKLFALEKPTSLTYLGSPRFFTQPAESDADIVCSNPQPFGSSNDPIRLLWERLVTIYQTVHEDGETRLDSLPKQANMDDESEAGNDEQ